MKVSPSRLAPALRHPSLVLFLSGWLFAGALAAEPLIAPGRAELRVDLQALADAGILASPTTTWPIPWQSLTSSLDDASLDAIDVTTRLALDRVRREMQLAEQTGRILPHVRIGGVTETKVALRSFSSVPRESGELEGGISFTGNRLSFNIDLTRAIDSDDDWRLDGSYVGLAIRNWAVVAGYPERWWGPGMQGSLILSTNARPLPQIGMERISAEPFSVRWLRWLGPWSISSFVAEFDDDRTIANAKFFAFRMTAKPLPQLELGFSRTAQLCGDGRPCGSTEWLNMLLGKDNRGANVSAEEEPGNQLAGFDGRWAFTGRPLAVYAQWIGEDSRQGGPQIGSWLRLIGAEVGGSVTSGGWRHRTYVEMADTICQQGSIGFGGNKYNCAYQHGTYATGYRYEGLPLGYPTDTDSKSLAVMSVFTSPGDAVWEFSAYSADINQGPLSNQPHSLSPTPARRNGLDVAHSRDLPIGRLRFRVSLAEQTDDLTGVGTTDSSVAVEWLVGYW